MSGRTTWRSSSSRMTLRLMAVAAVPLLLLGTMAPAAAKSPSAGVTVHPAVKAKVTKDKVSALPKIRGWQKGDPIRVVPEGEGEDAAVATTAGSGDPVVQTSAGSGTDNHGLLSSPIQNFAGIATGSQPMDPTGDVGPNHYVQMVNSQFQVFNKTGGSLAGPSAISQIWVNAGDTGECSTTNDGDPIVLYDHLADRWLLSQFDATAPTSPNASRSRRRRMRPGRISSIASRSRRGRPPSLITRNFGVWPDGYYLSTFEGGAGLGAYVFERSMMLTGNPARTVEYGKTGALNGPAGFRSTRMLPSDLDGPAPPAGSPNYFIRTGEDVQGVTDRIDVFEAAVNWGDPLTSSFTNVQTIATAAFNFFSCPNDGLGTPRLCIDQPNTAQTVELSWVGPCGACSIAISAPTRPWSSIRPSMPIRLATTPVSAGTRFVGPRPAAGTGGSTSKARMRRRQPVPPMQLGSSGGWAARPWIALATSRWRTTSSTTMTPIRSSPGSATRDVSQVIRQASSHKGRRPSSTAESASNANRWGDYTHLSVDPTDDCTFWYTAEWIDTANVRRTQIASFNFPSCSATDLSITKTDSPDPIAAGGILTYTLNVSNAGPSAATDVVVTDVLPAGVTYLSDSDSCVQAPAGTLTCSLGTLASGASTSFTISVRVPASFPTGSTASIINTATVSADQADSNPGNNTATATTQVLESADLRLLKECKPDQPNAQPAGTSTFCDIYVDNLGPSMPRRGDHRHDHQQHTVHDPSRSCSTTTAGAPAACPPTPIGPTTTTTITCTDDVLPSGHATRSGSRSRPRMRVTWTTPPRCRAPHPTQHRQQQRRGQSKLPCRR